MMQTRHANCTSAAMLAVLFVNISFCAGGKEALSKIEEGLLARAYNMMVSYFFKALISLIAMYNYKPQRSEISWLFFAVSLTGMILSSGVELRELWARCKSFFKDDSRRRAKLEKQSMDWRKTGIFWVLFSCAVGLAVFKVFVMFSTLEIVYWCFSPVLDYIYKYFLSTKAMVICNVLFVILVKLLDISLYDINPGRIGGAMLECFVNLLVQAVLIFALNFAPISAMWIWILIASAAPRIPSLLLPLFPYYEEDRKKGLEERQRTGRRRAEAKVRTVNAAYRYQVAVRDVVIFLGTVAVLLVILLPFYAEKLWDIFPVEKVVEKLGTCSALNGTCSVLEEGILQPHPNPIR